MKYILIIGDGMADNPVPTLDNKTPLQHAAIPVMDGLAAKGEVGNVVNCPAGLPAGSDTAILSIFGADPNVCYTGRSPLEAAVMAVTSVVPHISRLPASSAVFWSPGLVNGKTSTLSGINSS